MSTLKHALKKDITREIEGVIKADDHRRIRQEIEEYVVTGEIQKRLSHLFDGLKTSVERGRTGGEPFPFNGVWISGYFGSGKSHLLKILAHLLDSSADAELRRIFVPKVEDAILRADMETVFAAPARTVLFNIDQLANSAGDETNVILEVFQKVFDRMQGYYDENPAIAEFERDLDKRGELERFGTVYHESTGIPWVDARSDVMFLERDTFVEVFSRFRGTSTEQADKLLDRYEQQRALTAENFAQRARLWIDSQEDPGTRLYFFVDEVGQFVGNSRKRMLNLQTIAETLATVCENRAWIFVTSQEDLDSVIGDAAAQQRNDFSRITARFRYQITLTSANVEEVIQKRLLEKTDEASSQLVRFYENERDTLRVLFRFDQGGKDIQFKEAAHFAASYPFVAYQYDLLQRALRGLSEHNAFTGRHVSRGERSMLEVFQHVGKELVDTPLVHFASFDRMFDGIRNTLKSGLIAQVNTAEKELGEGTALRVLKALLMVKYVQDFRATRDHIVTLLLDSVSQDIPALRTAVEEALAVLEHKIYVQRSGDLYEYLTNEEQDVEVEIKNTAVEYWPLRKSIADVVFDKVLKTRKFAFESNGSEYGFSRLIDEESVGAASGDLAIHLVSHLHPHAGDVATILNQAMGRKHLLVVLQPDELVAQDLRLYHQTDTWLRRQSATDDPTRARIIAEKRAGNDRRYRLLTEQHIPALLDSANTYVFGQEAFATSKDRRQRVLDAFQELVTRAYPNLRMLAERYTEDRLLEILQPNDANRLFSEDASDVGEDEAELQTWLNRRHGDARQATVASIKEDFMQGQYGWPEWAVLCVLAKLFMRHAVEVVSGSKVLDASELYGELRSNRGHERLVVRPAQAVDTDTVNRLKRFFHEFFHRPSTRDTGKEIAIEIKSELLSLSEALAATASRSAEFPFVAVLDRYIGDYRDLAGRDWMGLTEELLLRENELLRAKAETVDAVLGFMNTDANRETYSDIRNYLARHAQNLRELDLGPTVQVLRDYVDSSTPYLNNATKRARDAFEGVRTHIKGFVDEHKLAAEKLISAEIEKLSSSADFSRLTEEQRDNILQPLVRLRDVEIAGEPLAPVIDQAAQIKAPELAKRAREAVHALLHPKETVHYASATEKRVPFDKGELRTPEDVAEYADAVKRHYEKLVAAGKRVSL